MPLSSLRTAPRSPTGHLSYAQSLATCLEIPLQVDVVYSHDFSPVHVDDLPVEDVLLQKKQVLVTAKGLKEGILAQFQVSRRCLQYVFHGDQPGSLARFEQQARNIARCGPGGHGDVFEAALDSALPIGDRGAEEEGKTSVFVLLVVHRRAGCSLTVAGGGLEQVNKRDAVGSI